MQNTEEFIKKNGYIQSRTGRYRRFPVWDELNDQLLREGVNMPIQSLAGDILLYALLGVDRFLVSEHLKSFIVLEIHDSIVLNLHNTELNILPEISNIMTTYFKKYVPFESNLKVDIKVGENWLDLKEVSI
jgi:DNA polymerase-1